MVGDADDNAADTWLTKGSFFSDSFQTVETKHENEALRTCTFEEDFTEDQARAYFTCEIDNITHMIDSFTPVNKIGAPEPISNWSKQTTHC